MNIIITKPQIQDARAMIEVRYKAWLVTYPNEKAGITVDDIEDRYKDAFSNERVEKMEKLITQPDQDEKMVVAKDGEKVIGICYAVIEEDKNKLQAIYILPEYQGQGIGTRLWNDVLSFFDKNKDIYVEVADYNNKAVNFYKKLGFVDTGKRFSEERFKMKSGAIIPEMEMIIKVSKNQKDWSEYYEITKAKPPSKLLVKALGYVTNKNKAIDIGGGALKDTRYLLGQGFDVTVIDKSPLMEQEAKALQSNKIHAFTTAFEDFIFPENEYDIATAMFALPFASPAHFNFIFEKIKKSLKKDGIFCGQFFGINDEWSKKPTMTFHTKKTSRGFIKWVRSHFF